MIKKTFYLIVFSLFLNACTKEKIVERDSLYNSGIEEVSNICNFQTYKLPNSSSRDYKVFFDIEEFKFLENDLYIDLRNVDNINYHAGYTCTQKMEGWIGAQTEANKFQSIYKLGHNSNTLEVKINHTASKISPDNSCVYVNFKNMIIYRGRVIFTGIKKIHYKEKGKEKTLKKEEAYQAIILDNASRYNEDNKNIKANAKIKFGLIHGLSISEISSRLNRK